jgi:hypothetical protein
MFLIHTHLVACLDPGWRTWPDKVAPQVDRIELHVPCRDPIDHLLSMCNHYRVRFKCDLDDDETEELINKCAIGMYRFHNNLTHVDKIDLKCFSTSKTQEYMEDYMDARLQPRRTSEEYVFRESNRRRDKEKECLPKASQEFKQRVLDYMMNKYDYFQFCNSCMGGEQDLFRIER